MLFLVTDGSYVDGYKTDRRQPVLPTFECLVVMATGPDDEALVASVRDFAEHMDISVDEVVVNPLSEAVSVPG